MFSFDHNIGENESSIINSIETNLNSHIFNKNSWHWFHLIISNLNEETIDSFVFAINYGLRKNNGPICMACTIGDPVLLTLWSWAIDGELFLAGIIDSCGLHLWCIVSVAQLCEAETSHDLKRINLLHKWQVSLGVQSHQTSTKQVELHSELGRDRAVDLSQHLVTSEQVHRIVLEIEN